MSLNMSSTSIPMYIHSLLPSALHPWVSLSYPVPPPYISQSPLAKLRAGSNRVRDSSPQLYGQGPKDVYFVIFCALAFTFLRELCLRYVLSAFARNWLKRTRRKERESKGVQDKPMTKLEKRKMEHVVTRFAEQGWSFLYCTIFWSLGCYVLSLTPAPFSTESMWGSYPNRLIPFPTKFYYLAQLGWWFHQIYVIMSEKRRNDHWQMFGHHVLTITLMSTSYIGNFTRVGTVIHNLMDLCDIFLPLAKMLRYLSFTTACDITFVVFLVAWLFSRQIGLAFVIRSVYLEVPRNIPYVWDPEAGLYLNRVTYWGFVIMLSILWVLATIWFYTACMVAVRVVRGLGAEDTRSDGEDEDEDALADVPESASITVKDGQAGVRKRK